jgi:hypothetical protein
VIRRLLLGTVAASFLALVGVQAAHFHKDRVESKNDSCAVCVLGQQSVAQAPQAVPSLILVTVFEAVLPAVNAEAVSPFAAAASARAPPAAA